MKEKNLLLVVDGIINLAGGILLLFFPTPLIKTFELSKAENNFYINILGAVLSGIGIALLLERNSHGTRAHGSGIAGVIVINVFGAVTLIASLLFGNLKPSLVGAFFMEHCSARSGGCYFRDILKIKEKR